MGDDFEDVRAVSEMARCERDALRARVAELEGEVGRLRGVVVESDKDLVVNAARKIARDHNMPLKSAEWMMLEALRVVRSNDNRDKDAALARATAAELECKQIKSWADETIAASDTACEQWKSRATAAEAREAGLRGALTDACDWIEKYEAWSRGEVQGDSTIRFEGMCAAAMGGRAALSATAPANAKESAATPPFNVYFTSNGHEYRRTGKTLPLYERSRSSAPRVAMLQWRCARCGEVAVTRYDACPDEAAEWLSTASGPCLGNATAPTKEVKP